MAGDTDRVHRNDIFAENAVPSKGTEEMVMGEVVAG